MRSFNRIILAAALFAVSSGPASAAPTLNVHIQNNSGAGVGSVTVAAIEFGMNGPSTYTLMGLTNASGDATFTLSSGTSGKSYNLYYSSHGFSPTIADQFGNPEYDPNRYVWAMNNNAYFSTFTVTPGLTEVGRLVQPFTNATANTVLFGGVYNMISQMQGGSGIVTTDGTGAGTLVVDNVPYADANTYNIGLYDPALNKGIGRNVMSPLDTTSPLVSGVRTVSYGALSFIQAVPPARVDTASQQQGGGTAASGASVEGVIKSTNTSFTPIPHMGINVKACGPYGYQWNTWANSDDSGRFQLYGLTPGVTYYFNVMGGCTWSNNGQNNKCYEPYSSAQFQSQDVCSTVVGNMAVGANDLLYVSSDVAYHSITLSEMPKSTGQIRVYVKSSSGFAIPNSNVNINPDGSPWPKTPTSCQSTNFFNYSSTPGFSNANVQATTGYALLDGLPSGNYMINVWTPFSSGGNGPSPFNSGPDGQFGFGNNNMGGGDWTQMHCQKNYGADDFRITIDTTQVQTMHVYNSSGTDLGLSSITYIVTAGGANMSGVVTGTLRFPSIADLSNSPITITLYGQCEMNTSTTGPSNCPAGNFTAIGGSGASSYPYTINVSTGYSYYMNVSASGWGRVNRGGGDNTINLKSTGTVIANMDFAPAGAIVGTLYKPGGTEIYTPSENQYIWVDAGSNNAWTGTQLQKDGTFAMRDVLPGVNRISLHVNSGGPGGSSSFDYALPTPAPTVTVTANTETTLKLNLVKANNVGINVNMNKLPENSVIMDGQEAVLGYKVIPLPAGTVLKGNTISDMLTKGDEEGMRINYSSTTGPSTYGRCGSNWPGGFCAVAFPSPAVYDFYLMRAGDFSKSSATAVSAPYPHFTLISSSKNVVIDDAHAVGLVRTEGSVSPSSGVVIGLTPRTPPGAPAGSGLSTRGNATLRGSVSAANFFRQADYEATGGDFEKFVKFLPVVSLYDEKGGFAAAGVVLPPPSYIAGHEQEFDSSFAQSYAAFKTLLDGAGAYGYEIRGLAPSACFTAVLTTPNYPSYQTKTCMGVSGSTTTVSINMDTAVGAGATLQGVVTSTDTAIKLANAEVQLVGGGIDDRSVLTSTTGAYKFEGLPAGTVRIKVALSGYASAEAEKTLVGSNNYVLNFSSATGLVAAGGSISGTVYSRKVPDVKTWPGAIVVAYDDTYNGTHQTAPLPVIRKPTDADGNYKLEGLIPGDTYKVFMKVPGWYTLIQSVVATAGDVPGIDFLLQPKPMNLEMFTKKGEDAMEFTLLRPQDFKTGEAKWSAAPYNPAAATVLNMDKSISGELHGSIPLASLTPGITYVLHGNATSYTNKSVTKEWLFGLDYKGNMEQQIDDAIIGDDYGKGNEVGMGKGGDDSALSFVAGGVLPISTGAVPLCSMKGEGTDAASVADKVAALGGADGFAGNLYTVSLTSVSINPDKGFELTLAYDMNKVPDDSDVKTDLAVSRYNDTTQVWETLPAVLTPGSKAGTVKVKLKTLASVLSVKGGVSTQQFSSFNGREYVVRPQAAGGGSGSSGTFAVIRPSIVGTTASGSKIKVFNYPNPFNLKNKAISNNGGAPLSGETYGTVIHVEVPVGNGGAGHVRIYTLSGELVNDLKTTFTEGVYNYVLWDGNNSGGQQVANGVYYGVVELSGKSVKLKDATFKMAVIK